MSTEDTCDICHKPLEECEEWQEIMKGMKEIKEGKCVTMTCEEFIKELEEDLK